MNTREDADDAQETEDTESQDTETNDEAVAEVDDQVDTGDFDEEDDDGEGDDPPADLPTVGETVATDDEPVEEQASDLISEAGGAVDAILGMLGDADIAARLESEETGNDVSERSVAYARSAIATALRNGAKAVEKDMPAASDWDANGIARIKSIKGATSEGEPVKLLRSRKDPDVTRLQVGASRFDGAGALPLVMRLRDLGRLTFESLEIEKGVARGDGDVVFYTSSAEGDDECGFLLDSIDYVPEVWLNRTVEDYCVEVESLVGEMAEVNISNRLELISGGVECFVRGENDEVERTHHWLFVNGTVYSNEWMAGESSRSNKEMSNVVSLLEMATEIIQYKRAGWEGFHLLPNLSGSALERAQRIGGKGERQEIKVDIDNLILYRRPETPEDVPFESVAKVGNLVQLIRAQTMAAYEETVEQPLRQLMNLGDAVNASLHRTEEFIGTVLNKVEFPTPTAEEFEQAQAEEIDDEGDGDLEEQAARSDMAPRRANLGSPEGRNMLERMRNRASAKAIGEDQGSSGDDQPSREKPKVGEVRRVKAKPGRRQLGVRR